jgi:hypothetical protein
MIYYRYLLNCLILSILAVLHLWMGTLWQLSKGREQCYSFYLCGSKSYISSFLFQPNSAVNNCGHDTLCPVTCFQESELQDAIARMEALLKLQWLKKVMHTWHISHSSALPPWVFIVPSMSNLCTYNYVMIPVVIAQKHTIYFCKCCAILFWFGLLGWSTGYTDTRTLTKIMKLGILFVHPMACKIHYCVSMHLFYIFPDSHPSISCSSGPPKVGSTPEILKGEAL